MRLSAMLAGVCILSCGLFSALVAPEMASAIFLGMAAPLAAGVVTILLVEQTTRTDMRRLTGRMTVAFLAKMGFYALYVPLVVGVLGIDPVGFSISFTIYFVALHLTEAIYFKKLFGKTAAHAAVR